MSDKKKVSKRAAHLMDGTSVYYKGITKEEWHSINQKKATLIDIMNNNSQYLGTMKEKDFFRVMPLSKGDCYSEKKELWNSRADYMYARHGRIVNEIDNENFYITVDITKSKNDIYSARMNRVKGKVPGEWDKLDGYQKKLLYQSYFGPQTTLIDNVTKLKSNFDENVN